MADSTAEMAELLNRATAKSLANQEPEHHEELPARFVSMIPLHEKLVIAYILRTLAAKGLQVQSSTAHQRPSISAVCQPPAEQPLRSRPSGPLRFASTRLSAGGHSTDKARSPRTG
jgi:hypothetical protein